MPPLLFQCAVLADRAQWLASLGMHDAARDHFLLVAELARDAGIHWLEEVQLEAAADCQARLTSERG